MSVGAALAVPPARRLPLRLSLVAAAIGVAALVLALLVWLVAPGLATLLVGAVVIERVFVIPGLGSLLLDSVARRELLTVQAVVMVLVVAVLVINFVVDTLYLLIDPRLRTGAR